MRRDTKCRECGRVSLRLSWSKLRVHEECKQKGSLMRAGKGMPMANTRIFFPGTVTDRVVRDWLADDPYSNPGLMPSMVEDIMEREQKLVAEEGKTMRWKDAADRDVVLKECIEAVTLIEPALQEHVLPFDYDVDFRFEASVMVPTPNGDMMEIILNGAMDILTRNPEKIFSVWDVKHTRDSEYWRHTRGQLSFYDIAVQIMFGNGTERVGLLQPLATPQVKPFVMTAEDRSQMMQRIMGYANDVRTSNFPAKPVDKELCHFCDVKHACSKFKPVTRDDGRRRMSLL